MSKSEHKETIATWQRVLADTPAEARLVAFDHAADEVASLIGNGLDKGTVADELRGMAESHGLIESYGEDDIQAIISDAVALAEERQQAKQQQPRTNGKSGHAAPAEQTLLPLIDIRGWQSVEPKPRAWIVRDRIPARNVTLLTGQGGVGKTLLMQQLSVATVLSRDWIGEMPEHGPVLFITAEDDEDEMHFRYNLIAKHYSTSFNELADVGLNLLSLAGRDSTMAVADNRGIVRPSELFKTMVRTAKEIRPRWIGLDTAADIFVVNERDRSQVRQCVSLLRGLALEADTAIMLLAHPSLTGISSGSGLSGSTAWHNSVRSRIYLKTEKAKDRDKDDDDDEQAEPTSTRVLEFMKSNYSALAPQVRLIWREGLLIPEQTLASLPPIDRAALDDKARNIFLALLDRYNRQDRTVSLKEKSNNYAVKEFAGQPEAKELHQSSPQRKKLLKAAMDYLLAKERIHRGGR